LVAEVLAVVCGRANAGTSKELNTIIFARILKEAMTAKFLEKKRESFNVTQGGERGRKHKPFVQLLSFPLRSALHRT
jgi:hypothetical protein